MTQLPPGWARAEIDDLVGPHGLFCDGDWVESQDQAPDGAVRLTQLADVGDGSWRNRSDRHLTTQTAERLRCTFLEVDDVLVARMPDPLGRACRFPGDSKPAVTVVDVAIIRPGAGSVRSDWLMWAINAPGTREQIESLQSGTTRKRISRRNLGTVPLPVPPLAEQERIVAAIEEAFSLLDAGGTALRNTRTRLKRMRDSVLTAAVTGQLVPQDPTDTSADKLIAELGVGPEVPDDQLPGGWTWIALGDILRSIEAGKSFAAGGRPADKGELGVIKVSAMTWGSFRAAENKVLPAGTTIDPRWIVREGDVLLSRANTTEYVGACVLVPRDYPNLILSDKSLRLVPQRGIDPSWLVYTLRARACRRQIEAQATGTKESMRNISQDKLRGIRIALPPPEEQVRIVAEVERQFSFIATAEQAVDVALARSAGLRRSVLKAAFEGRLVEQDPADEPASVLLERIAAERAAAEPRKRAPGRVRGKVVAS